MSANGTQTPQEILIKLYSLRVSELQAVLAQFGYAHRNQAKGVLQNKIRDELLKNPQIFNQVAALIVGHYTKRYGPPTVTRVSAAQHHKMARHTNNSNIFPTQQTSSQFTQPPSTSNRNGTLAGYPPGLANIPVATDVQRVKLVDLPFYERVSILLTQSPLLNVSQSGVQSAHFRVSIPQQFLTSLSHNETDPLPRFEIQLRMGVLDASKEQPDDYPKSVRGSINGSLITFPPLVTLPPRQGHTQGEQRRQSRPVNISSICYPFRNQPYQLALDWQAERPNYFVTIVIVKHLTPQILHDRLKDSQNVVYAETQEMVRKSLRGSGEDDIAMDILCVSLIDPLSRCTMNTPSRSRNCPHLACFDLLNYLMMNEKRPTWKCPACNKPCPYNSLVYDRYFHEIITTVNGKSTKVELLIDGWREPESDKRHVPNVPEQKVEIQQKKEVVIPKVSPENSNHSTPSMSYNPMSSSSTPAPPSVTNPPLIQNAEIITLSDSSSESGSGSSGEDSSDEEDDDPAPVSTNGSRKRTHAQSAAGSVPEVITLGSDSEDEPPAIRSVPLSSTPLSLAPAPQIKTNDSAFQPSGNSENMLNIFDTQSLENCTASAEIAMDLFKFLQRIEANGLVQNH